MFVMLEERPTLYTVNNGNSIHLWNVGFIQPDYTVFLSESCRLHTRRLEDLKTRIAYFSSHLKVRKVSRIGTNYSDNKSCAYCQTKRR
jgi:hypothetical protein